jgi:hypothetical protein
MAFVTACLNPARSALEFHRPHPLAPVAKPDEVLLSFVLLRFPELSASVPALPATAALIRSAFSWKALIKRFFVCLPGESIDIRAGKFGTSLSSEAELGILRPEGIQLTISTK